MARCRDKGFAQEGRDQSVVTIAASHSWHIRVRSFSRSSYETQLLLRGEELAAGRAVWVPPTPFDGGYDIRGPKATRVGKESARTAILMFHRSAEGIRLSRPHTSLAGARSLRSTATDDRGDPPIPRWDESIRAE